MLLLLSANGAPVLTRTFLKHRYVYPVDAGFKSKTWRGILSAVMAASIMALLLGIAPLIGVWFALLTMLGDLLASFCKRRLGKQESSRARGLDTVPESLLPAWVLKESLLLSYVDIALIMLLFFLIEEFISPILYKWHIRQRPY
jgi:CDP-2,3-bis-(O-geranylgeranyl)-sn-glycerol synthase